tara:strand:- start:622 stop:1122 length:501 start_codon:yes stop_codon:yes gene_type:complete
MNQNLIDEMHDPVEAKPELLELVTDPDDRLHQVCKPVKEFGTPELIEQVGRMTATMYAYAGVGLAANQVGYDNRVVVVAKNPERFPHTTPLVLINPRIESRNGAQTMREGCLSFPGRTSMRKRAKTVRITAFDVDGNEFKWQAKKLAAQCIQHEIDHLNGKTFLEK